MRSAPGDKVKKQLNVSINAESFAPVFHLGTGIDTAVAFLHFHLRFFGMRRLQIHDRGSGARWNLDRCCDRNFAGGPIDMPSQELTLGVAARIRISRRQTES